MIAPTEDQDDICCIFDITINSCEKENTGQYFEQEGEKNKSTKEKWTKLRGSAKMTFSVMAIIILSYPRKSMFECRGYFPKCIIYTLYYKNTS